MANRSSPAEPEEASAPLVPLPPREEYPLTPPQRRLWFLEQLQPHQPANRMITGLRLSGSLTVSRLEAAINGTVARHASLRARFHDRNGVPMQSVIAAEPVPLPLTDLSDLPAGQREPEMQRQILAQAREPMDLSAAPALRVRLFRLSETEQVLAGLIHHIIFDASSNLIFLRELARRYTGKEPATDDADGGTRDLDYMDYALWLDTHLSPSRIESELRYWKEHLGPNLPVFAIPTDRPRRAATGEASRVSLAVPDELQRKIKAFAVEHNTTVATVLLTAFQGLLTRYTETESILIGLLVSGRSRPELEPVLGFFVNELVLRIECQKDDTLTDLLERTRKAMQEGLTHQDLPYDDLVRALRPMQQEEGAPLFHVAFNNKPRRDTTFDFGPALTGQELLLDIGGAPFDLSLDVERTDTSLDCHFDYDQGLFERRRMDLLPGHFQNFLEGVLQSPECALARIPILTPEEEILFASWNETRLPFRSSTSLPAVFEEQVARSPDALALVGEESALSFEALNRRANQIARVLRARKVRADQIVGLTIDRSLESVVALFGILKSGGAYVPIDPALPSDRIALILDDARVNIVIAPHHPGWGSESVEAEVFCLDGEREREQLAKESEENPPLLTRPGDLAYVIYTSGSTGKPKGVLIEHRSALNMWAGFEDAVLSCAPQRPLHISLDASLSFDASVQQVLTLLGGHALYISSENVRVDPSASVRFIREHKIDVVDCVPTQMRLMTDLGLLESDAWRPALILVGGEPIEEALWQKLAHSDGIQAFNAYGPTECTVNATCCRISGDHIHIGRPMANLQAHILDEYGQKVPLGAAGELYLGGVGVARGYLNRILLNAQRFLPDPFSRDPGSRLYRTGDLVRWVDGNIEFLGRIDTQVKIRGLRIELGEIEAALSAPAPIREAAAIVHEGSGSSQLVGFLVPRDPGLPPDITALHGRLKATLPAYMVPSALLLLEELPRMPSGKVDRPRLAELPLNAGVSLSSAERSLETATEKRLGQLWEDLLGRSGIDPSDDFFSIGGHSLLAVRMVAEIEKIFQVKVPLSTLVKVPVLEKLASTIEAGQTQEPSRIVHFNEAGRRRPLFLVTPFQGDALMFRQFSTAIDADQPVFSLQPPELTGTRCQESVEKAASETIALIRKVQPEGPYQIGGYCIGGQIALEMACQLQECSQEVIFLGLLDSLRPGAGDLPPELLEPPKSEEETEPPMREADSPLVLAARSAAGSGLSRRWHNLRHKALRLLQRKTFEFCRRTGMRQPAYLADGEFLEEFMVERHQTKVFTGPITLFRSEHEWPGWPQDLGWKDNASEGIQLISVPGDHIAILHRPNVEVLSRKLSDTLNALPANAGLPPARTP